MPFKFARNTHFIQDRTMQIANEIVENSLLSLQTYSSHETNYFQTERVKDRWGTLSLLGWVFTEDRTTKKALLRYHSTVRKDTLYKRTELIYLAAPCEILATKERLLN